MLRVLEKENKWKRTDKPDSVTALACYDGHSSGTFVTKRLKHPTRRLRGTHINACLFGFAPGRDCPFHPPYLSIRRLVSVALILTSRWMGVTHYPALWSPDFPLHASMQRPSGALPDALSHAA